MHFTRVSSFNYLLRWQESLVTVELRSLNHELKIQYSSTLCPDSRFQGHHGFYATHYEMLPTEQPFHCYTEKMYPHVQNQIWEEMSQNARMSMKSVTLQLQKIFISVWCVLTLFERWLILSVQWRITSRTDCQTTPNCNSQHIPMKASSFDLLHLVLTQPRTLLLCHLFLSRKQQHKDTEEDELCLSSLVLLEPRQHTVMLRVHQDTNATNFLISAEDGSQAKLKTTMPLITAITRMVIATANHNSTAMPNVFIVLIFCHYIALQIFNSVLKGLLNCFTLTKCSIHSGLKLEEI